MLVATKSSTIISQIYKTTTALIAEKKEKEDKNDELYSETRNRFWREHEKLMEKKRKKENDLNEWKVK